MSIVNQVLATAIISFMSMTMGIMYTWPSSTYILFSSTNTTLNRVMTNTELSLLGSSSSIAAIIITPFSGYLLDWLGRKRSFIVFSLAQVLSWVIVVCSNKVEAVLAAVFLTGLSGCIILVIPMHVCEICEDSIRGSMASVTMTFIGIGSLISYLFGGFLEYRVMNYVCLSLTVLGLVMLSYIKESPLFLMKKGLEKEATASMAFYRGAKVSSKEVQSEMNKIRDLLNPTLDVLSCVVIPTLSHLFVFPSVPNILGIASKTRRSKTRQCLSKSLQMFQSSTEAERRGESPEEKMLRNEDGPKEKLSKWKFIMKSRATRKALFVCTILFTASIFQGLVVVQVYAEPLFKEAVPSMSAMWSSVLFAIICVISGFIGAYLVESIGRRNLMIYSSIASGIFCVILGTQIQLKWGPNWLTAVFMDLYCVGYCLGAGIVPYVLVAEAFLPEIKSLASMIAIEWAFICNFVVLFIFNPIVTSLGLGAVFYIFATSCFLSAIFCALFQPETKGLTIEAIQVLFAKRSNKL